MAEKHRAKFYDLLCAHTDRETAEYVMSCLASAPLGDLVTREHLDVTKEHLEAVLAAKIAGLEMRLAAQREADREEASTRREADRKEAAAQREADLARADEQREKDREQAAKRQRVLVGAAIALALEMFALEARWQRNLIDLLASAI